MISAGIPTEGIKIELKKKFGSTRLPSSVVKYFFCMGGDQFRCLPTAGGLYDQRYRDFMDFQIIENRLAEIKSRGGK